MLIALAILGIGLAVILQGIAQGVRARRDSEENLLISARAAALLDGLLAGGEASEGVEEGEGDGLRWTVRSEPLPAGEGGGTEEGLMAVTLAIEAPSGRSWEVTTLLPPAEQER